MGRWTILTQQDNMITIDDKLIFEKEKELQELLNETVESIKKREMEVKWKG